MAHESGQGGVTQCSKYHTPRLRYFPDSFLHPEEDIGVLTFTWMVIWLVT